MDTIPAMDKTRLFSKMATIMGALNAIPKMGMNTYHNYKYVTASDVADVIREQMAAQNLAFFAETVAMTEQNGRYVVEYQYTFACGDTGAVHTCRWYGEAIAVNQKGTPDDKALTKAATTAQKYFLLKTFIVSTADDPDMDHDAAPPMPRARAEKGRELLGGGAAQKRIPPATAETSAGYAQRKQDAPPAQDEQTDERSTKSEPITYVEIRATAQGRAYIVAEGGASTFTREPFRAAGIACDDWTTPGEKHILDKPVMIRSQQRGDFWNIIEVTAA